MKQNHPNKASEKITYKYRQIYVCATDCPIVRFGLSGTAQQQYHMAIKIKSQTPEGRSASLLSATVPLRAARSEPNILSLLDPGLEELDESERPVDRLERSAKSEENVVVECDLRYRPACRESSKPEGRVRVCSWVLRWMLDKGR